MFTIAAEPSLTAFIEEASTINEFVDGDGQLLMLARYLGFFGQDHSIGQMTP